MGFSYLETDVHATADGVLVAVHDPTLDRVTDVSGRISELAWAEVAQARLADGSPLPRISELLEALPQARFAIDLKSDLAVGPMVRLLRSNPDWLDRICLGSFSDVRLTKVRRRLGPDLCTSTGPAGVLAHRLASAVRRPTPTRYLGNCLQVPDRVGILTVVTPAFVEAAHAQELPVHVWTVDDPAEMTRLLDLGVDGLMTDRPEVLRSVLTARGDW
jgi:glycerophosphoryl diester phosphodiesterase